MCGINGVFWYRGGVADAALVRAQADVQRHRGPDDSGVWAEGPVGLGHRRLSIVDLSPGGHQPMANEDGIFSFRDYYQDPDVKVLFIFMSAVW